MFVLPQVVYFHFYTWFNAIFLSFILSYNYFGYPGFNNAYKSLIITVVFFVYKKKVDWDELYIERKFHSLHSIGAVWSVQLHNSISMAIRLLVKQDEKLYGSTEFSSFSSGNLQSRWAIVASRASLEFTISIVWRYKQHVRLCRLAFKKRHNENIPQRKNIETKPCSRKPDPCQSMAILLDYECTS